MTLDEWADLDEDVEGELVDGVLVEEEVPTYLHERVVASLVGALLAWVFASETKLRIGTRTGRKPDVVAWLAGARRPDPEASSSDAPPSVVVEVVTKRRRDVKRDRIEKLAEYAAFGVAWYWLVDPQQRTFEVLELGDGRYATALAAADGAHAVPGCDGLLLDLDALWAELDAMLAERGST
jgi:Uma2 family endonuclease